MEKMYVFTVSVINLMENLVCMLRLIGLAPRQGLKAGTALPWRPWVALLLGPQLLFSSVCVRCVCLRSVYLCSVCVRIACARSVCVRTFVSCMFCGLSWIARSFVRSFVLPVFVVPCRRGGMVVRKYPCFLFGKWIVCRGLGLLLP